MTGRHGASHVRSLRHLLVTQSRRAVDGVEKHDRDRAVPILVRMRGIWQLAAASAVVGTVLVGTGFLLLESGGSNKRSKKSPSVPGASAMSYGNANIKARALGGPYRRTVVVRVRNKRSGTPLHDAKVTVHGEMTSPHVMTLYNKVLHEVTRGEYRGPYTLIMPGDWKVVIVVTSKKGDTSTSALPVRVTG